MEFKGTGQRDFASMVLLPLDFLLYSKSELLTRLHDGAPEAEGTAQ